MEYYLKVADRRLCDWPNVRTERLMNWMNQVTLCPGIVRTVTRIFCIFLPTNLVLLKRTCRFKCHSGELLFTMTEYEIEKKGDVESTVEDASDKVQAGAKAVANKIKDPSRDLDTEYSKEKIKEKLD